MTDKTRRQLVKQIESIATLAMNSDPSKEQAGRRLLFIGEPTFVLVGDAANEYVNLYQRLVQDEGWGDKFSEDYVDKSLQRLIRRVMVDGNVANAGSYFAEMIEEYETYKIEHSVYMILTGLTLQLEELSLGQVVLKPLTDALIESLVQTSETILMQSIGPDEAKARLAEINRQLLNSLKGKGLVCAEFHVVAEPARAQERAEEEVRRVLDLLRFALPVCMPDRYRVAVGLVGEVSWARRLTPIQAFDGSFASLSIQQIGPLTPFVIDSEAIETMTNIGVFKLSEVLLKGSKKVTPFEEILLRSLHWFANAQTQNERENELLSLVTCLEAFFTPDGNDPISNAVAEGVAFVIGTDPNARLYLFQRVKELYGKRSRVSHGGSKPILDRDLEELKTIGGEVMARMIQRKDEFAKKGKADLLDWVRAEKFGSTAASTSNVDAG